MKTTDVELIHRVLDGDDSAFTVLVKKYQKAGSRTRMAEKLGISISLEEITQDTFLKAYQELATLKKPQRFCELALRDCGEQL